MHQRSAGTSGITVPLRRLKNSLLALLLLNATGCGSSVSSTPPHGPQFTTLDPPAPLTLGGQGFFTLGIASNGIVAGYLFDSSGGFHGYLRQLDGTITIIDAPDAIQGIGGKTTVLAV